MQKDRQDDRALDLLLRRALKQQAEPDEQLQRKVLRQWKERQEMKKNRKWVAAAVAAACVLAVSVSVGAAGHYLSSREVAEHFDMDNMAKAFSDGEGIEINQTQSYGGYNITLMGVASGENLGWAGTDAQPLDESKTYAIVAFERADGTPMPDGTDDAAEPEEFFLSPLIEGCNPVNFNAMTMNGGASWTVIDGVRYQLVECDNVEIFADHRLHLCVMDRMMYDGAAYDYDPQTGEIRPNADYEGMNLLFDLPLDAGKANPQKAKEYLSTFTLMFPDADKRGTDEMPEPEKTELSPDYTDYIRSGAWKKEAAGADRIAERTPAERTADGGYELPYQTVLADGSEICGTLYFYDEEFVDGTAVQKTHFSSSEPGMCYMQISIAEKGEDGSVTIRSYVCLVPDEE